MLPGPRSERAIILAPLGRESELAAQSLRDAGFAAETRSDLAGLCEEIEKGAGLAIIAEEAIRGADLRRLSAHVTQQPPWSDFPIILMIERGHGPERNLAAAHEAELLGNVTFLERPFEPATLTSMVRTAIRGRRLQYAARARLENLAERAQRLQSALTAGRIGTWMLDVDGLRLRASDTCKSHFGRGPHDPFTYEELSGAVHPEDLARVQAAVRRSRDTGDDYVIEHRNVWPDRSLHWVEIRARAIRGPAGNVEQLVGVTADITARKELELERESLLRRLEIERRTLSELTATLEQRIDERTTQLLSEVAAREQAQMQLLQSQKMESVGKLTGGVAHDFNNLLMAVIGNLELLRKHVAHDARAQRFIDGAMQGAERGASLTQRMLVFARQQDLKTGPADMGALVLGMRDLLERSLGPRCGLHIQVAEGLPPAKVDANQIELAVLNLVINARDAMPEGGPIRITVDQERTAAEKDVRPGSYLRVRVTDAGVGMSADTLKRATEPFFSTKPQGKGTGLGLSMVQGLVAQLDGVLELDSAVGKGTTVSMLLPVADKPVAKEQLQLPECAPGRRATILVVDDDPLIAMSTVGMLEDLGHDVIEAGSPRRALEILETPQAIDLMMTDHAMPGMTGIELAEIARRKRPGLLILLASGYGELPSDQQTTLPRLSKPYRQEQLRQQITQLLPKE